MWQSLVSSFSDGIEAHFLLYRLRIMNPTSSSPGIWNVRCILTIEALDLFGDDDAPWIARCTYRNCWWCIEETLRLFAYDLKLRAWSQGEMSSTIDEDKSPWLPCAFIRKIYSSMFVVDHLKIGWTFIQRWATICMSCVYASMHVQ